MYAIDRIPLQHASVIAISRRFSTSRNSTVVACLPRNDNRRGDRHEIADRGHERDETQKLRRPVGCREKMGPSPMASTLTTSALEEGENS